MQSLQIFPFRFWPDPTARAWLDAGYLRAAGYLWAAGYFRNAGYLRVDGYLLAAGYLWAAGYFRNAGYFRAALAKPLKLAVPEHHPPDKGHHIVIREAVQ